MATIRLKIAMPDVATSVEMVALVRFDTSVPITPLGFFVDEGNGFWAFDFTEPEVGLKYRYTAKFTWDDASTTTEESTYDAASYVTPQVPKSYNTLLEADTYFASRLHSILWTQANNQTKQAALNDAFRIINSLRYIGQAVSNDAEWPRTGVSMNCVDIIGVPNDIKYAECDIAYALLSGVDPEKEIRSMTVTSRGYSSVRITYRPELAPEWLICGVPSFSAWTYLAPYLQRGIDGGIKLNRVS